MYFYFENFYMKFLAQQNVKVLNVTSSQLFDWGNFITVYGINGWIIAFVA